MPIIRKRWQIRDRFRPRSICHLQPPYLNKYPFYGKFLYNRIQRPGSHRLADCRAPGVEPDRLLGIPQAVSA
jgi:hypothetical protein